LLVTWVKRDELDAGELVVLITEEREELRRLRREVKVLRQDKVILRKRPPSSLGKRSGVDEPFSVKGTLAHSR
jgi:hypothetical protein